MGSGGDETFVHPSIDVRAIRSGQSPLSRLCRASRSFYPPTRSLAPIHSAKGKMESRGEDGAGDAMGHGGVGMRKEGTVARGRLSIAFIPD